MHTIHLIDKLDSTHIGPEAVTSSGEYEEVFLSQGCLDGACGHYSLFMCLLINGLITRGEALDSLGFKQDGRTNIGKLARQIKNENFFAGTYSEDIEGILDGVFKKDLLLVSETGSKIRDFVVENIQENNPVMLSLYWNGGAHWVVVVGLDYCGQDDDKELYRFLLLDPSGKPMEYCAWNGVVDVRTKKGRYPYLWWGNEDVSFGDAIAFIRV